MDYHPYRVSVFISGQNHVSTKKAVQDVTYSADFEDKMLAIPGVMSTSFEKILGTVSVG